MLLWVSQGGTGRQLQLWQSILETFLAECDYRLGEGRQECWAQPDSPGRCVHGKKYVLFVTPLMSRVPITALQLSPRAAPGCPPPCDTPTRDAHLGSCLSFIAQVGIAEAGWCSTKLSGYQSKAIAVSCIHRLPLCTAMYTNTHTGPSPRCTLSGGSSGGGIQVRGRGLILPSPTAPGAPATSQAGNRGNMGSLGQTHEPSRGQMCPDCDRSPQGCCGAPAPSNTPLKY